MRLKTSSVKVDEESLNELNDAEVPATKLYSSKHLYHDLDDLEEQKVARDTN